MLALELLKINARIAGGQEDSKLVRERASSSIPRRNIKSASISSIRPLFRLQALYMDPSWIAHSAMVMLPVIAALGIRYLKRKRQSDAADPSHEHGASLQVRDQVVNVCFT